MYLYRKRHYSYECKASAQERPYVSRPSRSQQLRNPKLVPKLTNDVPNPLEKKTGAADEELAKKEAERDRRRELDARDEDSDELQRRSPTRGLALHHRHQGCASKPDQAPRAEKKLMKYHAHRPETNAPEAVHHIADEKPVARGSPLVMRQSFGGEMEIVGAVPARRARRGGTEWTGILVIKVVSTARKGKSVAALALSNRKAARESVVSAHSVNEYF
ncbi:hypothetical protein NQ176_g5369 [Zarea fungicola]|uniref:Uncharacterized protein n=1 Tax=Zarea fungicola TaxID=93591 RepID=A0ACC1N8T6_9HYPO|nr:hypothetical protein NQ176_g5369 [Lecanicillium fungicola]